MPRIDMTQEEKKSAYKRGCIMREPQANTLAFKFLGMHWSSNKNRKKPYSFKSRWYVLYPNCWYHKIDFIVSGTVHRIKGSR